MSETAATLRIKIDPSGAVTGSKVVEDSLRRVSATAATTTGGMGTLTTGISKMALASLSSVASVAAAMAALRSFSRAAMEAEANARRLTSAVERKGAAFRTTAADMLAMSSQLERVTAFEDDAIQKAQSILLRFDQIDDTNIRQITAATLDFAEATGQDAASAATALGKALLVPGEAMRALKEVGITLTQTQQDMVDGWNETGQSAKSVSLILGLLNEKIGGEAEAAAKTGEGGLRAFNAQLGNLKEIIGAGLIPDLTKVTNVLGAFNTVAGSGKFNLAEIFVPFLNSDFLEAISNEGKARKAADDLALSLKLVGDNGRHVADSQPWVKPKTQAEIDAAKKAAEEFANKLQAIIDRLDPLGAAERDLAEQMATVSQAIAAGGPRTDEYRAALARLKAEFAELRAVTAETIPLLDRVARTVPDLPTKPVVPQGGSMSIGQYGYTETERRMDDAAEQFGVDVRRNLSSAIAGSMVEFVETGKISAKTLGDSLKRALLAAAEAYIQRMAEAKLLGSASGGGGGGGLSSLASLFGGGGSGAGISSGAMALGAWVAVAAAAVAVLKHQVDRANAVRYQTTVQYNTGSDNMLVGGKLMETGGKIADAFKALMDSIQSSTGALLEGAHRAAIAVRNDKEGFRALIDGVVIGTFKTMDEAIVAAMKKLFSSENLKKQMDPIVQQVVNNFDAKKGPQAFAEAVQAVSSIVNEISGLTEIEIRLRDLPAQSAQLAAKLHEMGVAMADAQSVATKWTVQQMSSIRDQITGHQMSAADQRAEKERQATMFNAELALAKANMAMRKSELEAEIEILKGRAEVTNTKYELDKWQLEREREFAQQGIEIAQAELDVRAAAGQASIALLQAQLEAIGQSLVALDQIKPIDLAEIRIPGVGGNAGIGNSGPSEAEIAAQEAARVLADLLRQLTIDLGHAYRAGNQWHSVLYDLELAMQAQIEAANGDAEAIRQINELFGYQLQQVLGDALASLGLQSVSITQQFTDLANTLEFLRKNGAITEAQMRELGDSMYISLVDSLLQYTDNEEVRMQLEDLRFRMEMYNYQLQFQMLKGIGLLTEAQIEVIGGLLGDIWETYNTGGFEWQSPVLPSGSDTYGQQAIDRSGSGLQSALDRLRRAFETYTNFLKDLQTSDLSGATLAQREMAAQQQYLETLALAQAGNLDAIDALPGMAQQWLQLAGDLFDPSSSGYQAILAQITGDMGGIQELIGSVLAIAPATTGDVVNELQTIADILREIGGLGPGSPGGSNSNPNNPNSGLVYFGPQWGWHPPGWAPSGGFGNSPVAGGDSASGSRTATFESPRLEARLARIEEKLGTANDLVAAQTGKLSQDIRRKPSLSGAKGWTGPVSDSVVTA